MSIDSTKPSLPATSRPHRLLGGGWHHQAYVAFYDGLHYPVVVKALRPDLVDDPSALRGLQREAEILESISHPVIARLLDAELGGERPHLVLELVEGPRLHTDPAPHPRRSPRRLPRASASGRR